MDSCIPIAKLVVWCYLIVAPVLSFSLAPEAAPLENNLIITRKQPAPVNQKRPGVSTTPGR